MPKKQSLLKQLNKLIKSAEDELQTKGWTSQWEDIRDNLLPDRGPQIGTEDSSKVNDGRKKRQNILTSVAERSVANLAAGLKSYLTTPSRPWFQLKLKDTVLNENWEVKNWLDRQTAAMHRVMNKSNFYDSIHNLYIELAGFGSAVMIILEDEIDTINCKALTCGEYYFNIGRKGTVNRLIRKTYMQVDNMVAEFGLDNVSADVKDQYERNEGDKRHWVYHYIGPNDGQLNATPPSILVSPGVVAPPQFLSIYWMKEGEKELSVSGFAEWPVVPPRWNVISNNIYGTECPGMVELGNIQMVYDMLNDELTGVKKVIDPPLISDGNVDIIDTIPGGVSEGTGSVGQKQSLSALYNVQFDIASVDAVIEKYKEEIRTGFFNNLFLMLSADENDRKTAFEVARLQEEKMSMLGPMIERLNTSALDIAIDRIWAIMDRQGLIEPVPEIAANVEMDIEYISLLAQAQKTSSLRSIDSLLDFMSRAAQFAPEAIAALPDWSEMTEIYRDGSGAPQRVLKSPTVLQTEREAAAAAAQRQQGMEMAGQLAAGAKDLSQAKLGENSALDAVLAGGAENLEQ